MITLVVDREDEVGAFIITSLGHRPTQRLSFLGMQVADVVGQVGACLAPEVEDYLHRLVWSGRVVDGLTMLIAFDGAMLTTVRVEGDEVVVGGLPELPDLRGAAAN
ncbi:MAG: hypothetical protein R3B72_36080 [Polyangiaceae bacterium]